VKRLAFLVLTVFLTAAGVAVFRAARPEPAEHHPPAARADLPLPAGFRQCQPRHWRYLVLPQR
jgi:hypothetical protein